VVKSSLIVGGAMFVLVLALSAIFSPLCALCLPLFSGLSAGYLTGMFDKPVSSEAIKRGAIAGAVAGLFAIFAQLTAAAINSMVLKDPQFQIGQLLGTGTVSPGVVWVMQLGLAFCVGLLNIVLMAVFGAGGGAIWANTTGRNRTANTAPTG
jgi:hypothetical protein